MACRIGCSRASSVRNALGDAAIGSLIHGIHQVPQRAESLGLQIRPATPARRPPTGADSCCARRRTPCSAAARSVGILQPAQTLLGRGAQTQSSLSVKIAQEDGMIRRIGEHRQRFERGAPHLDGARMLQGVAHLRRGFPIAQQAGGFERLRSESSPPDRAAGKQCAARPTDRGSSGSRSATRTSACRPSSAAPRSDPGSPRGRAARPRPAPHWPARPDWRRRARACPAPRSRPGALARTRRSPGRWCR